MPCRARGFTLLEIIVVIAIIGVLVTFVRLAIGDGGRGARLRDTAQLLQQLSTAAAQEAVFASRPIALAFRAHGVELLELREGAWQQRQHDALFRLRRLPDTLSVSVAAPGRDPPAAATTQAPAIFFPDGSAEALALVLRDTAGAGEVVLAPGTAGYVMTTP